MNVLLDRSPFEMNTKQPTAKGARSQFKNEVRGQRYLFPFARFPFSFFAVGEIFVCVGFGSGLIPVLY